MKEQLFRKVSIERVNSPEQLNEYIRVANPSVWLVLAAVVVLLSGVCVWGIFGRVETTLVGVAVIENGRATGYFAAGGENNVEVGMEAVVGDVKGTVVSVAEMPVQMGEDIDPYICYLGGFTEDDFCYQVELSVDDLSDKIYEAKVILDSVAPIRFVIQ